MAKRRKKAEPVDDDPHNGEHNANAPVADVRAPDGRWAKGYTPPGAGPWQPSQPSPNPTGRPKGVLGRMKALAAEQPGLLDKAALLPFTLMEDKRQEGATRLGALKLVLDRLDGAVALKIEGLSEAQMREWALRVGQELVRALPAEHHQAVADAIMRACGEPRNVEAEPVGLGP